MDILNGCNFCDAEEDDKRVIKIRPIRPGDYCRPHFICQKCLEVALCQFTKARKP